MDNMFYKSLEDMTGGVFVENGAFNMLTASNVGLGDLGLTTGYNNMTYHRALEVIKTVDLRWSQFPKMYHKKIRGFRNSIVFSFGPEMESIVGVRK